MGNCCLSWKLTFPACLFRCRGRKVLKIVKPDGEVLELTSPTVVKDVLVEFSGVGIGLSPDASHNQLLLPDFELKMGQVYYIIPSSSPSSSSSSSTSLSCIHSSAAMDKNKPTSGITNRIRLVITKKQLHLLLAKQISVHDLVLKLQNKSQNKSPSRGPLHSSNTWKPTLQPIPEEIHQL